MTAGTTKGKSKDPSDLEGLEAQETLAYKGRFIYPSAAPWPTSRERCEEHSLNSTAELSILAVLENDKSSSWNKPGKKGENVVSQARINIVLLYPWAILKIIINCHLKVNIDLKKQVKTEISLYQTSKWWEYKTLLNCSISKRLLKYHRLDWKMCFLCLMKTRAKEKASTEGKDHEADLYSTYFHRIN